MENAVKIIGLTGNIATGKSVIRRMLANAGALGLDADLIAHRTQYPGGPAYQEVINAFGEDILAEDHHIDRQKLGEIVFSNPEKLNLLEEIVHPSVTTALKTRIQACACPVVVIEAIKLLEADLDDLCDSIWVSHAAKSTQVRRLMETRGMTEEEALTRINAQPPQSEKLSRADVVINTEGSFRATWRQAQDALNVTIKPTAYSRSQHFDNPFLAESSGSLQALHKFWDHFSPEKRSNLFKILGTKMVLPTLDGDQVKALALWDNWNFTAALQETFTADNDGLSYVEILSPLVKHARLQQAELLLIPNAFADGLYPSAAAWGFKQHTPAELPHPAWREATLRAVGDRSIPIWAKILAQPFEEEREIIYT
jgi:dephospho-CoA kinase